VLVVANDPAGPADVATILGDVPIGEVMVVAPALNRWAGRLVADTASAERDAAERMEATVSALRATGMDACGIVGDADPLLAVDDALTVFAADEVVIATAPERLDGWLGEILAARARAVGTVPVRVVAVGASPTPRDRRPLIAA
jgi:GABA permease